MASGSPSAVGDPQNSQRSWKISKEIKGRLIYCIYCKYLAQQRLFQPEMVLRIMPKWSMQKSCRRSTVMSILFFSYSGATQKIHASGWIIWFYWVDHGYCVRWGCWYFSEACIHLGSVFNGIRKETYIWN